MDQETGKKDPDQLLYVIVDEALQRSANQTAQKQGVQRALL
ncbi:MAG: hypothetical protein QOJ99_5937 [Bryobacterales bacterium]|jgi:hypothetical protein|nr:hypothetical protein [Bryobacterales bacterium]